MGRFETTLAVKPEAASLTLGDLQVGREVSCDVFISAAEIDRFAELSGDASPLHVNDAFARRRGFERRVVHGAYLAGLVSRLLGMHLPGRDCLLQTLQMKFVAPAYVDDAVRLTATIDQVSEAAGAAVVKVTLAHAASGLLLASAKASVGFTRDCDHA